MILDPRPQDHRAETAAGAPHRGGGARAAGIGALRLAACLLLVAVVAAVGGLVTRPEIPGWYAGLTKPAWTPPDSVFPIAWTLLYALMGFALWRLWQAAPGPARRPALRWFLVQLALNALWSPVFFGAHAPWAGLAVILLLVVSLAIALRFAFATDLLAGWLLVPYMAWIGYATSLNLAIALLN